MSRRNKYSLRELTSDGRHEPTRFARLPASLAREPPGASVGGLRYVRIHQGSQSAIERHLSARSPP